MIETLSTKELAARLGTSPNTIKRWASAHILDAAVLRATVRAHPRYIYPAVLDLLKPRGFLSPPAPAAEQCPNKQPKRKPTVCK